MRWHTCSRTTPRLRKSHANPNPKQGLVRTRTGQGQAWHTCSQALPRSSMSTCSNWWMVLLMAVKPPLTTRRAPVGRRRCVMSGSRRSVFPVSVFPVTVAPTVLGLDWVVADAGEGESGERPSRPRGVPIAVLLLASSTDGLVRPDRPKSADAGIPMLLRLLLLRPSSGCASTSSTR